MTAPVLTLSHVGKTFGATRALHDASLTLHSGEVTALLGENGAGKSTLVKILAGVHRPDSGEIRIGGNVERIGSPLDARRLGISVVHQESVVFDNLTVAENILIDARPMRRGLIDWPELRRRAVAILQRLETALDPQALVGTLSIAQKHLIQIARGLSSEARIVVLDEPTAALSHREAHELHAIIARLKAAGCAVLFISHKLEEVLSLADRYAVFRDGAAVGEGAMANTDGAALIRLMVGRTVETTRTPPVAPSDTAPEVLRVEALGRDREFRDVSLRVRRGEILGIYGLVGAGRTELLQCLFGLTRPNRGQIYLDGAAITIHAPATAVRAGLAYVPEDRQQQGAIGAFPLATNIGLASLPNLPWFGRRVQRELATLAADWIRTLEVRPPDASCPAAALSGGNQQKVVLAKWLATAPRVLLLDEPTKGIDIGAKSTVHQLIRDLAARGMAIVMVSSELPEIMALAQRTLVMRAGRVRGELSVDESSAERLAQLATGP